MSDDSMSRHLIGIRAMDIDNKRCGVKNNVSLKNSHGNHHQPAGPNSRLAGDEIRLSSHLHRSAESPEMKRVAQTQRNGSNLAVPSTDEMEKV